MAIRLTESHLRRIIRDEVFARRSVRPSRGAAARRPLKEGKPGADEDLANAMMTFVESWMDESGVEDPQAACDALMREVSGFCSAYVESY